MISGCMAGGTSGLQVPPTSGPWLRPHANPCKWGSGSLLPWLRFALWPVCTPPLPPCGLCVCRPGRSGLSGDFPADLHVALRAFLFTSLQSEGEPDACSLRLSSRHTGPMGAGGLAAVLGGVPAGVPASGNTAATRWSQQPASGPQELAAEGADGL